MKEQLEQYVKQIKERYEDCRGNEQATKQCLIGPLFAILGYDTADPRECKPEYRADFGKGEKAATPVDWAFLINGALAFFVEAKEVRAKIPRYAEQLGMYFAKEPDVKLGILTNGTQWQFYTDLDNVHVMDKEPFLIWNVLHDEPIPVDFLTLLQKSQFKQPLDRPPGKRSKVNRGDLGVSLAGLLAAGYLAAPLVLFRQYNGRRLEATLLPDGKVEFEDNVYDSCSKAAEAARTTVTGRRMNTNGWVFWQYAGDQGQPLCLDDARQRFRKAKGK